jgi:hypothetical protein
VFGSLGGDPAHGRTNFTPAGPVLSGRLGGSVAKAIRRSPEEVSEAKGGQGPVGFVRHARNCLPQPACDQVVRECFGIREHSISLVAEEPNFNYVLTTMC